MSAYPAVEGERRVPHGALLDLVTRIFQAHGMREADARTVADNLVDADVRGVHSHGVLRVPDYVAKLTHGGVDPVGAPTVVRDRAGAIVVDGGNSMGQVGAAFAMRAAIERAATNAVALAAVRGSNHCGAMAYYAMLALERGMIGLAATNALPTMAPWGGVDKIVGINPLAAAIPSGSEPPIVFDAAFSGSSHGKIRVYEQKGLPIPDDWAFDVNGRPTTDASAAIEGLLRPIGGYKGVGLAVVMGVLSTVLSSASYGTDLGNMVDGPRAGADGHFFIAIDVAAFEDPAVFTDGVDRVVRQIRTSRTAEGTARVYSPGELEFETERAYRRDGIPLNAVTLEGLIASARESAVDVRVLG